MNYQLRLFTAPAKEPVLLDDAKRHLRLETQDAAENQYVTNLIKTARRWAENFTSRCFIEQTWDLLLIEGFPSWSSFLLNANEVRIPRTPLKLTGGITHVKYLDTAGAQQTLPTADYVVAGRGEIPLILPAYGKSWPAIRTWVDANGNFPVEIRFIAGYGTEVATVPEHFRQAILLLVGHWYEHREEVSEIALTQIPAAAEALLAQERFFPW